VEMAAERVERQGEYHGRGRATKSGITPRVSLLPAERVARQVDLQWKRETFECHPGCVWFLAQPAHGDTGTRCRYNNPHLGRRLDFPQTNSPKLRLLIRFRGRAAVVISAPDPAFDIPYRRSPDNSRRRSRTDDGLSAKGSSRSACSIAQSAHFARALLGTNL